MSFTLDAPIVIATLVLGALLAAATMIDIRTHRIPNLLNAALVASGLGASWALERDLIAALIGAVAGYGALFAVNWAYARARGRDGLGLGDAKLAAGAGAWLGWSGLPFVILLASSAGLIFVAVQRLRGRALEGDDAIAFGPFLSLGVAIVWLAQVSAFG